jgi:hypothetical protein
VAAPLAVLLLVAGVVGGALLAMSFLGDPGLAIGPRASATPPATAEPLSTAEPSGVATIAPTEPPTAPPTGPPPEVIRAGVFRPDGFAAQFEVTLDSGWFAVLAEPDIVSLGRTEGWLTFASDVVEVFRDGESTTSRGRPRDLVSEFAALDGVAATKPTDVRIDRRRGLSIDLTLSGAERAPLFGTADATYFLEPDRTTRIIALDAGRGTTVVIVIEPSDGTSLATLLAITDPVLAGLKWR